MKIDIQCGDIILFDRPCIGMDLLSSMTCFAAKTSSFSGYDHLGLVVEDTSDGKMLLLEANANGVTLYPLDDRLRRTKASRIAIRKLVGPKNSQFKQEIWKLASDWNGKVYNRNFIQMSSAFVQSYWNSDAATSPEWNNVSRNLSMIKNEMQSHHYSEHSLAFNLLRVRSKQLTGHLNSLQKRNKSPAAASPLSGTTGSPSSEALDSYYCSQLVAEVLAHQGVIMTIGRRPEQYLPADFSSAAVRKNLVTSTTSSSQDLLKADDSTTSQTAQRGYYYSPDLVISSPRALMMTNKDGVCRVESTSNLPDSTQSTATRNINAKSVHSSGSKPTAAAAFSKEGGAQVQREWKLSVDDVLSPQITHQLARLGVAEGRAGNVLQVSGLVDVLTAESRYTTRDKTQKSVATSDQSGQQQSKSLRTVGLLSPGLYSLHSANSGSNSNSNSHATSSFSGSERRTLELLQRRYGSIYLRARDKSAMLKLIPAASSAASTCTAAADNVDKNDKGIKSVSGVASVAHHYHSLAPQILHQISRSVEEYVHSDAGSGGAAANHVSVPHSTVHSDTSYFVPYQQLLLVLGGQDGSGGSDNAGEAAKLLHALLAKVAPHSYLKYQSTGTNRSSVSSAGASVSAAQLVNLSLLCEVDCCLVEGGGSEQVVDIIRHYEQSYYIDGHGASSSSDRDRDNNKLSEAVEAVAKKYRTLELKRNSGGTIRATSAYTANGSSDSDSDNSSGVYHYTVLASIVVLLGTTSRFWNKSNDAGSAVTRQTHGSQEQQNAPCTSYHYQYHTGLASSPVPTILQQRQRQILRSAVSTSAGLRRLVMTAVRMLR